MPDPKTTADAEAAARELYFPDGDDNDSDSAQPRSQAPQPRPQPPMQAAQQPSPKPNPAPGPTPKPQAPNLAPQQASQQASPRPQQAAPSRPNPWPEVQDRRLPSQSSQEQPTAKSRIAEANKSVREHVKEAVVAKLDATDAAEKLDYAKKRLDSDAIAKEHFWVNHTTEALEEASRDHLAERTSQAAMDAANDAQGFAGRDGSNDKTLADAAAYNQARQEMPHDERLITAKTRDEMEAGKAHIKR